MKSISNTVTSVGRRRLHRLLISGMLLILLGVIASLYLLGGAQFAAAADTLDSVATRNAALPACSPQQTLTPTALDLGNARIGLTTQIDAPQAYTIHGSTAKDIRNQIQNCGLAGGDNTAEFAAQTNYRLNWTYVYTNQNGVCQIASAKVGLHVVQQLPTWQPSENAPTQLEQKWSTFATNLRTHEDGHIAIDQRYASELLADLQHFPATSCADFQTRVEHLAQQDVAELNQANDNYDFTTAHGATQGATLPQ